MSAPIVLMVDPDKDLATALQAYLGEAYTLRHIRQAAGILQEAFTYRPGAILLANDLPDQHGLEVLQKLRHYPRLAFIPVLFLVTGTDSLMPNRFLEAGAHDFITKPFDLQEFALRLRKAVHERAPGLLHPHSRLPTGTLLTDTLAQQPNHTRLDVRLVGLESLLEVHGFVMAGEVLAFVGNVLYQVINEVGTPEDFIGQENDSHFIILTDASHAEAIQKQVEQRLNTQLPQFHSFIERDQGYIEVFYGENAREQKPLLHVQITALTL